MANETVIQMIDVTKRFGDFVANDKVNLELKKGEIHALLGENGAGKSTLMNILSGLLEPSEGEVHVKGKLENIDSPSKAANLGIGMVHQHFMLVDAFTVTENIILGNEVTKGINLQLSAGSTDNIKPELVLQDFYQYFGEKYHPFNMQIHRVETYEHTEDGLRPLYQAGDVIEA